MLQQYETTRSALTAYPETTLGTMFNPENETLLKPAYPGGNEYFLDRNGHVFYYIMEFYRTGEITWIDDNVAANKEFPVTKRALDLEIEYFNIPLAEKRADRNLKKKITILDEFSSALEVVLDEAISRFVTKVEVGFSAHGGKPWQKPFTTDSWYDKFAKQGYGILENEMIVGNILKRIREHYPSIKHDIVKSSDVWGTYNKLILTGFDDIDSMKEYL